MESVNLKVVCFTCYLLLLNWECGCRHTRYKPK